MAKPKLQLVATNEGPEDLTLEEKVEAVKRGVELSELIEWSYKDLEKQIFSQKSRYKRVPSPFKSDSDSSKSFVIFQNRESDEGEFHWADSMAPKNIPRDIIGFVMAFDQCTYEVAVEKLWEVLQEIREGEEALRENVQSAEENNTDAEIHYTRERFGEMLKEVGGQVAVPIPTRRKDGRWR
jgi:hypothetical protein